MLSSSLWIECPEAVAISGRYSKSVCQKYNKPVDYPENRCIVKIVKEKTISPMSRMED